MKYQEIESPFGGKAFKLVPETEQEQSIMDYYNAWNSKVSCNCENSTNSYYVPDNVNEECAKHHYRCVDCNKITQIG